MLITLMLTCLVTCCIDIGTYVNRDEDIVDIIGIVLFNRIQLIMLMSSRLIIIILGTDVDVCVKILLYDVGPGMYTDVDKLVYIEVETDVDIANMMLMLT